MSRASDDRSATTERRRGLPTKPVTLEVDGREVTVPEGTSVMRAAALAGVTIPKLCATDSLEAVRLMPPVPRRGRRPQRLSGLVHHAGRVRDEGAHAHPRCSTRLRRGVMELYMSDHPLDRVGVRRQRQLRAARDGRRGRARRGALRPRGQKPSRRRARRLQSVFHFRSRAMHRVLAMRARVRGGAGHFRADDRRTRLRLGDVAEPARAVLRFRVRFVRRVRAGLPDRRAGGKVDAGKGRRPSARSPPPAATAASDARSRRR